jgi:hypothetical protein
MRPKLLLPAGLEAHRRPRGQAPDKGDLGLAQQLLGLLEKGLNENLWPSFVVDYRGWGIPDDVGMVYHLMTFARARGYALGLKAAQAAGKAARADCEKALEGLRLQEEEHAAPLRARLQDEFAGIERVAARLQAVLDQVHVPGV